MKLNETVCSAGSNCFRDELKSHNPKPSDSTTMVVAIVVGIIVSMITLGVYSFNKTGQSGGYGIMAILALLFISQIVISIASFVLVIVNAIKHKDRVVLSVINFVVWTIGVFIWFQN